MSTCVIFFSIFFIFSLAAPAEHTVCGYESCPATKDEVINLHLVPHSHDKVGKKTFDQYYYGTNNDRHNVRVQIILDTVVRELLEDPTKRFVYAEISFFWKWWLDQSEEMRDKVKHLVDNGRLEFIGGGWSINDEATTYYQNIIDQFTWGFRKLEDMFGSCGRPRVGWQIDSFGHSRENAAIMAGLGFDGLFLGRIDWEDRLERLDTRSMEMIWNADPQQSGEAGKLFTRVLHSTYSSPKNFCFDPLCQEDPIVDDKNSPLYNIEERASGFLQIMDDQSASYRTKHVLIPMGDDFHYQNAHVNFRSMDKLIKYINTNNGMKYHAFYSTPSCYLNAVNKEKDVSFPSKDDDFFPYSTDNFKYWAGYYTSRPTLKRFERIANNYLQVCKQLHTLSGLHQEDTGNLDELREALGILQHHNAITGTARHLVVANYARILSSGIEECHKISNDAFKKFQDTSSMAQFHFCLQLNISSCPVTEEAEQLVLTLYNPLSRPVDHLVRVPVPSVKNIYRVLDPKGMKQVVQLVPVPNAVARIPGRVSKAAAELVFLARDLPPLGFRSYYVSRHPGVSSSVSQTVELNGNPIQLGYGKTIVKLNKKGQLKGVKLGGKNLSMGQDFFYYVPTSGCYGSTSGANVFSPAELKNIEVRRPKIKIFKGPLVSEIHYEYNDWISQVCRIENGSSLIEFEWLIGPIPIDWNMGKEVITRYNVPDIENEGDFVTDSNGRSHLVRSTTGQDPQTGETLEVARNYYPIVTDITLEDPLRRLTVITDRAQGGSSLQNGTIELMIRRGLCFLEERVDLVHFLIGCPIYATIRDKYLASYLGDVPVDVSQQQIHRRLTNDDDCGESETLDEEAFGEGLVARGKHWLTADDPESVRLHVQEKSVLTPWLYLTPTKLTYRHWESRFIMERSGLTKPLPKEVHILTLEPWSNGRILLRLESLSKSSEVNVDIKNLFAGFSVEDLEEMTLGGNMKKENLKRMFWNEETSGDNSETTESEDNNLGNNNTEPSMVTLSPRQIKTFILKMTPRLHAPQEISK